MHDDRKLRVLTWHVHGSYLYYMSQSPCDFYLPHKRTPEEGYGARTPGFSWGDNVISVPAGEVRNLEFDCIVFQSRKNYLEDQFQILSEKQRALPKIYLEHDPPREHPVDTRHVVKDPAVLIVHVTHFNNLMWDNNGVPSTVVAHGVVDHGHLYTGTNARGIVVINGIVKRGRRLGLDVFERVRRTIPLDIVGMGSEEVGGLGEIRNDSLPAFIGRYRFFFNPIRYTSLGLAVCEAMTAGVPVVGLATTEMPDTIRNGHSGYISADVDFLISRMQELLNDPSHAFSLSAGAREIALQKFNMKRFIADWLEVLRAVVDQRPVAPSRSKYFPEQTEIKEV